ncbi:MAG: YiiD C-terminal domain-containing protein [Litorivicinus sp.]
MTAFERMLAGTPLAQGMNLRQVSGDPLELVADFDPCRNQLDVAFGGALAAGMALAGWVFFATQAEAALDGPQNPLLGKASQRFLKPFAQPLVRFQVDPVDEGTRREWQATWARGERVRATMVARVIDEAGVTYAQAELHFVL